MGFIKDGDDIKLGEGSYGVVYPGKIIFSSKKTARGAQKQSFHYHEYSGLGTLREIQIMSTLSSKSQFIPNLLGVFFGEYKRKERDTSIRKNEGISFVTEIMDTNGAKFFGKKPYDLNGALDMIGQLIAGVAFIHDRLITHRDIKPDNLLISTNQLTGKISLKICDFGFSQFLVNSAPSTPGTNTAWYRAPEICWSIEKYGATSDVWAVGATIYEILTGNVLYMSELSNSDKLFEEILKKNPNKWTQSTHSSYIKNSSVQLKLEVSKDKFCEFNPCNFKEGKPLINSFVLSKYYNPKDHATWVKLDKFLTDIFSYQYKNRVPCWTLIHDPLLHATKTEYKDVISNIGSIKNNEIINFSLPDDLNEIKIKFFTQYIKKNPNFTKRVLFHAVDLCNRILPHIEKYDPIDKSYEKIMIVCIYFYHKYWPTLSNPRSITEFFRDFFPPRPKEINPEFKKNIDMTKALIQEKTKIIENLLIVKKSTSIEHDRIILNVNKGKNTDKTSLTNIKNKLKEYTDKHKNETDELNKLKIEYDKLKIEYKPMVDKYNEELKPYNECYYKFDEWIYNFDISVIINNFPSFKIYRPGIFEMVDEYPITLSNENMRKMFLGYIKIGKFNNGSYRKMYRELYNKCIDPNYKFQNKFSL